MEAKLIRREVLPSLLAFATLVAATLLIDALLHVMNVVWIGRYLGIPGSLLIAGSFWYSLRRRRIVSTGHPGALLRLHERMAWFGSLLVLVHAGIHFNAILPWLAVVAMLANVGSGLTGKFLLERSRKRLNEARERMRDHGIPAEDLEDCLFLDSLTYDVVKQWRVVHMPITLAFAVLAVAHVLAVLMFWGWR